MRILITGINGYLGSVLHRRFKTHGHNVRGINRDMLYLGGRPLEQLVAHSDVVINLAGAPILQRWSRNNKIIIYNSRVVTTHNLVDAINNLNTEKRPKKLISISAVGIYSNSQHHTEESTDFNSNFLGTVAENWELALNGLEKDIQHNIFRLGLVLGKQSMLISKLLPLFKLGLGGKIANGKQPFPFIHEDDVTKALIWASEDLNESGTFNLLAPQNITNADFTKEFGKQVNRPTFFTVPAAILKLVYGAASTVMLESPSASAKKIQEAGYIFDYPNIATTLANIIKKP